MATRTNPTTLKFQQADYDTDLMQFVDPADSILMHIDATGALTVSGVVAPNIVNSFNGRTGDIVPLVEDYAAFYAPIGSSGPVIKTARVDLGTIASATPSAVTTVTWPVAFADNLYTITCSVVIAETPPNGAATELITVSSIELTAAGVGFRFVVCNQSSGSHACVANFVAVHD